MSFSPWVNAIQVGCLLCSSHALAQGRFEVPFAYIDAAAMHSVPSEVLYAVALQESHDYRNVFVSEHIGQRPWPWTLNVKGKSLMFKSKADACVILKSSLNNTQIIDVGLAQLNVRWQPQLFGIGGVFENPCDALDPYVNLDEAAKLLRERFEIHRDWVVAAGRYHRPAGGNPAFKYSLSVSNRLKKLGFSQYEYESAAR